MQGLPWTIVSSAAIAVVFTQGSIFKPLRDHGPKIWRDLASCALCSGVWIGLGTWFLFSGFPHASDKLGTAREVAIALGVGSLSGCAAVLFVALWDWLEEKPGIRVPAGATLMYTTNPQLVPPSEGKQEFPSEEPPTNPAKEGE